MLSSLRCVAQRAAPRGVSARGVAKTTAPRAAAVAQTQQSAKVEPTPGLQVAPPPVMKDEEVYSFLTPGIRKTTKEELQWDQLGFKIRPLNGYVSYTNINQTWDAGAFVPAPYILLHINSGALHYGISCFEGMKAFACKDGRVRMLNPTMNAARMQQGARKLRMPEVPTDMFIEGVSEAVKRNVEFVPPYGHGAAMYIRPLLFASGQMLGLAPLSEEYTFFVTVLPAGGYFSGAGGDEGIDALVMEHHDRAAPMGTGAVKAAGNYAADLEPVHQAKEKGYGTTLYLDAKERRFVEEFSVANFVGITKCGKYVTPDTSSILKSTTNMMLQQLARDEGMVVEERPIDFDAEIENFTEIGMVGTAAVLVRVKSITRGDKVFKTGPLDVLARLRGKFTSIQCGDLPDTHNWMMDVCAVHEE